MASLTSVLPVRNKKQKTNFETDPCKLLCKTDRFPRQAWDKTEQHLNAPTNGV